MGASAVLLHHFTTGAAWRMISADGVIRPSFADHGSGTAIFRELFADGPHVAPGVAVAAAEHLRKAGCPGPFVVHLTANPDERTATSLAAEHRPRGDSVVVRISVRVPRDEVQPWLDTIRPHIDDPAAFDAFTEREGFDPRDWFVLPRAIPRDEWVKAEPTPNTRSRRWERP